MTRARKAATTGNDRAPKTPAPTPQLSDRINSRTNNTNDGDKDTEEVNGKRANNAGIGDAGVNDEKATRYTANRSADA